MLKKGLFEGCRKVLSLNGCFIKGPWNRQILVAVGRDANNQIYPVAWAITQRENEQTWKWFIELLCDDLKLGDGSGWTTISDQQKGLVECVSIILPNSEHRLCARHVYANLRRKWRGLKYRHIFWQIAKFTTLREYIDRVKEMQDLCEPAREFLSKKNPKKWCRAFFSTKAKADSVDNNMAEVFNGSILEARYKTIVSLLEDIFLSIMSRIAQKKEWAEKYGGRICPRILTKLNKGIDAARWWKATKNGNGCYSVRHGCDGFVVDLRDNKCSCRSWDLTGIPCPHAIGVMREEKLNPLNYVDACYNINMYKKTYAHALLPIDGMNMWDKCPGDKIIAPVFKKRKRGRLEIKMRPVAGENGAKQYGYVSRKGGQVRCSKCQNFGHNKKTCTGGVASLQRTSGLTTDFIDATTSSARFPSNIDGAGSTPSIGVGDICTSTNLGGGMA